MKLRTHGLALEVEIESRTHDPSADEPYDDWLRCEARIEVPSFAGTAHWNAQATDFRRFRNALQLLTDSCGAKGEAELAGVEPGMRISLVMHTTGQITGKYEFSDYAGAGAGAPTLTGEFELDQTFLPDLIRGVHSILSTKATPAV